MKERKKILLTSFQTWLPHQKSNSSDDLLVKIQKSDYSHSAHLYFLRHLPVDIEIASIKVITEIDRVRPDVIICCGMAEKRDKLTVESQATCQNERLYSSIDLIDLTNNLTATEISHDAGKFVCEGLYYRVLKYVQPQKNIHCIFVHVPILKNSVRDLILRDFYSILLAFADRLDLLIKTQYSFKNFYQK